MMRGRPKSLPTAERYDGVVSRYCDFRGISTGSIEGNFEAFRKDVNDVMKACASANGGDLNSAAVYGSGRLTFEVKHEEGKRNDEH